MKRAFFYLVVFFISYPVAYGSDIVEKISDILPEGWKVDKQQERILMEKEEEVPADAIFSSMPPFGMRFQPTKFWFDLTASEYKTPSHYQKLKEKNRELREQGHAFFQENEIESIPHEIKKASPWQYKYLPRNLEEDLKVKNYKNFYSQIVCLPDYHYEEIAYFFGGWNYYFENEVDEKECLGVRRAVLDLLNSYSSHKADTSDPFDPELITP